LLLNPCRRRDSGSWGERLATKSTYLSPVCNHMDNDDFGFGGQWT
jgi:hypothetical protein